MFKLVLRVALPSLARSPKHGVPRLPSVCSTDNRLPELHTCADLPLECLADRSLSNEQPPAFILNALARATVTTAILPTLPTGFHQFVTVGTC